MQYRSRFMKRARVTAAGVGLAAAWYGPSDARAQSLILNDVYHAQTASFTCAIASMEMALDVPVVTNNNPFVANLLAQGDGNYVPLNALPQNGAQSYIYYMVHTNGAANLPNYNRQYNINNGQANLNNNLYTYSNPYVPRGAGSDLNSLQFGLNVLDNPRVAGLGNDGYVSYNVLNGYYASRTIAAAMKQTGIPAVIAMNPNPFGLAQGQLGGQHAISVFGVNTSGNPGLNAPYTINGFFVHDPWTGYAMNAPNLPANVPMGLGENTYLRYGFDKPIPGAPALTLPGGGQAAVSPFTWFNYFVPSYGQPAGSLSTLYQTGVGYKFAVEPQGPVSLDSGGPNGTYLSLPAPTDLLPSHLTGAQAAADAAPDLMADGLNTELGFENGSWDTADMMLLQDPLDPSLQGEWLIPYDGSGGVNDVTGAILIDENTGVIDQATWFNPTDPVKSATLSQIDALFMDQLTGNVENDNSVVPEPSAVALALAAGTTCLLTRRRVSRRQH